LNTSSSRVAAAVVQEMVFVVMAVAAQAGFAPAQVYL
jgi:hypothetical protein